MARPDQIESVLLDASCLIGYIKGEPDMACLRSLFAAVERGDVQLVESSAILAEVLPTHRDPAGPEKRAAMLGLLQSPEVLLVDVSVPVARRAAELRATHGMSTWDAGHLATAVAAGSTLSSLVMTSFLSIK